jgi:hypothetical protein
VDLSKNRTALAVSVAAAGIVTTAALAMAVWPALVRPEPPLEKTGDDGLRIRVVEPPKAAPPPSGPLDVGLSQAAQAMAKGREALFVQTPPPSVAPPPARLRTAPVQIAQADSEDDLAPPPEPVNDLWQDEGAWRQDRFERAQRQRWEDERLVRRERERWEEARERDPYEDRYDPPPLSPPLPDEDPGSPGPW